MASSYLRITVLVWVNVLASYAISTLITYLTDVWRLTFTHAAQIVNVFWGVTTIMPFTLQYVVDTLMGNYWMVLASSIVFTVGLVFLTMSTPPVLSKVGGNCSRYKRECVGIGQEALFYVALALVALGMSGHLTSLKPLIDENKDSSSSNSRNTCLGVLGLILVMVVGAVAIPYIKAWYVRFGITAVCSLVATLMFLSGKYNYANAQGSPLTTVFRVVVASASKAFHTFPSDAQMNGRSDNIHVHKTSPSCLGFLDKAAIVGAEQQQNTKWKLCSETEVEETKTFISIIPICTTFFMLGVVSSIGNTYFLEQANHMNQTLGHAKVPLTVLVLFRDLVKSQFSGCYSSSSSSKRPPRSCCAARIGVAASMIFAVLCCVTAAKVEGQRLHVVAGHGLLDRPKESIPMSMFRLLPQFLLLGGLDGNLHGSVGLFFSDHGPASMDPYMARFAMAVLGVGYMGSVVSVYSVDKISSQGGRPSWFQDTLNRSRLDKYYWVLAALSAGNFVVYVLVSVWYARKDVRSKHVEEQKPCAQNDVCFDD